jgi:hypothetical protein
MFSWWYTSGLLDQLRRIKTMLVKVGDQFSIALLLKTLFQPFRQIDAGKVEGALGDKIRAWFDKLISRFIGGLIRSTVMIIGLICLLGAVIIGLIRLVFWLVAPLLPLAGIVLTAKVGTPWL